MKPHAPVLEAKNDKTLIDDRKSQGKYFSPFETVTSEQCKYSGDDSAVPISQTSTLNDRLFEGNIIYA